MIQYMYCDIYLIFKGGVLSHSLKNMFKGNKTILKAYTDKEIMKARNFVNESSIARMLIEEIPFPLTEEDELNFFKNNSAFNTKEYHFAIFTLHDEYIGGCSIFNISSKNRRAKIGIFIGDENYQNKGYGTDVIKTILKFSFNELNLNKISLDTFSFNTRARKVYERLGFKVDGILRDDIFRDGRYYDTIIMSIVEREYREIYNEETSN